MSRLRADGEHARTGVPALRHCPPRRTGVREQWVYGRYERGYVYLEDGVVVAIQD